MPWIVKNGKNEVLTLMGWSKNSNAALQYATFKDAAYIAEMYDRSGGLDCHATCIPEPRSESRSERNFFLRVVRRLPSGDVPVTTAMLTSAALAALLEGSE